MVRCVVLSILSILAVCLSVRAAEAQQGRFSAGYDPASGFRRATAELVRAVGEADEARSRALLNQSRALIQLEQARALSIENAGRSMEVFLDRKRKYEQMREYDREKRKEALAVYLENRQDPDPLPTLTPSELNPSTGGIAWPPMLLDEDYTELRTALEKEYAVLARTPGAAGHAPRIRQLAEQMRGELRAHVREMPSYEYIAARRFVDGLANSHATVRFSAAGTTIAGR